MKSLRIASLVAALAVTAPVALVAQQEPPVVAGDRVRVSAPSIVENRVVGIVVSLDRDALVVRAGEPADALHVRLADVTKLEVHQGRKSRFGRGLLIGLAVGVGVGASAGALAASSGPLY